MSSTVPAGSNPAPTRPSRNRASIGWLPDGWNLVVMLAAIMVALPLLAVLSGAIPAAPEWHHLSTTVLPAYLFNTLLLTLLVGMLAVLFAVPCAWLVTFYDFPGRRFFEWGLVLPLAIPTYVAAFVYIQVPELSIPLLVAIREQFGFAAFQAAEATLRYGVLVVLMAAVLYPYIYLSVRSSLTRQRSGLIEAARLLSASPARIFFSIVLPLSRPALLAGLALVIMEVVNDYGAVHFFGVPTLTEGIFRTWFGLGDRSSALRLACFLMLAVAVVVALERQSRGRAQFHEAAAQSSPIVRKKLSRPQGLTAALLCLLPLAIGFVIPVAQLCQWAWQAQASFAFSSLYPVLHSIQAAGITALVLTSLAAILAFAERLHNRRLLRIANGISCLGYATPGAVVAVGVMTIAGIWDNWFGDFLPLLSGSLAAICLAYGVRFMAVALQPQQAGMQRTCGSLDAAARLLGRGPMATFFSITLPLMRSTLIATIMLVFVDILKELPLTMILRPAGFETLATSAFGLAKEGQLQACAIPSLLIALISTAALQILNKMLAGGGK